MIRALTSESLGEISLLFAETYAREPWNETWSTEDARTRVDSLFGCMGFVGFVACAGEKIVGAALSGLQSDEEASYRIRELFVRSDLQRQGIGRRLLENLERFLWMQGVRRITLITAPGSPAASFYLSHGYFREGTMERWVSSAVFARNAPEGGRPTS